MQETKLYNSKIVDNSISGDTADGSHITRPIVKTEAKDLILTQDFLFRLVAGAIPAPANKPVVAVVHPGPAPTQRIPSPVPFPEVPKH